MGWVVLAARVEHRGDRCDVFGCCGVVAPGNLEADATMPHAQVDLHRHLVVANDEASRVCHRSHPIR
jgi:hypothetical protein